MDNMELNKYFNSQSAVLNRSQIHFASYNPRKISEEGRRALKKSIKLYGIVGGIVVNKQTGNTIVGGHQKVSVLDELNKFPDNDYTLRVELIDVDEKKENGDAGCIIYEDQKFCKHGRDGGNRRF